MGWLPFWRGGRRRSPFNNLGRDGLTCGEVTPQLFVGGELGPHDWRALTRIGVTVAINLQQEQQDFFSASEDVDGYLWLPAPDGLAPSLQQLQMGVEFIRAAVESEKGVFVHCKAGQGRAPLLCACYLLYTEDLKPLEAIARVREARPRTQLTPEQSIRLREYAAMCEGLPEVRKMRRALRHSRRELSRENALSEDALHQDIGTVQNGTTPHAAPRETPRAAAQIKPLEGPQRRANDARPKWEPRAGR